MRIESALNASREGITSHGQAIAVLSDNIANSNTTAYKTARAEFSDIYASYTGIKDDGVVTDGNGAKIAAVRTIFNSGEAEFTGRSLDVAIEGNGFFITGDADGSLGSRAYTRAGNFKLDVEGYLVTSDGKYVLATAGSATPADGTAPTLTRLNLASFQTSAVATTELTLGGNVSSTFPAATPQATYPSFAGLRAGASHVETMEVVDSLGTERPLTLGFFKTAPNTWTVNAYADGADVGGTAGVPVQVGSVTGITFGADGSIAPANQAAAKLVATPAWAGGAAAGNIAINFGQYTQYAAPSSMIFKTKNGSTVGEVQDYEIDKSGRIIATLTNGSVAQIGTIQLATFVNVDGLQRIGNNSYIAGTESGAVRVGVPGSKGSGVTRGASLERSTTDLSGEFVNLVVYQRGYQANSQILNAANEILQQTIGLIR